MKQAAETPRRNFLKSVASMGALSLSPIGTRLMIAAPKRKSSDIRIKQVQIGFENYPYRSAYRFGGRSAQGVTLINVDCTVETASGRIAKGFGSMPLGNLWSFPSKTLSYDATLDAMKQLAQEIGKITEGYTEFGHPIDINFALEPEYLKAAIRVAQDLRLGEPIPRLCTLVTASAFDAAAHDAFGKAHRLNCYLTYGPEFMSYDLGRYLSAEFRGKYPGDYLLREPEPWLWCNHSVGAGDPIDASDVKRPIKDGLPETLAEWIVADGLTHLKLKLDGNDFEHDIERIEHIDRVTGDVQTRRGVRKWYYSLDFNEQCPNADYLLQFMARIRKDSPAAYGRITFIEQPTRRDLRPGLDQMLFKAAKLKPVVMDESLTGFDALQRGRRLGYSGIALKACKGQSQSVLMNAAAHEFRMYLTAQDLTCPGASLIQSAGIAAHIRAIDTLESNGREYVPEANVAWRERFPGLFKVNDGKLRTANLNGPGLGAV